MKILQVINSLRSGGAEKLIVDACIKFRERGLEVDVLLLDGTETPFFKTLETYKEVKIMALGGYKNIYNPYNIIKLISKLKGYDIIHVHLFPASYWVAFSSLLGFIKQPIIFTEHNTTNRRRNSFLFKIIDKIVYTQFKEIITISDAVDVALKLHLGSKFKNFKKIYNGINLEKIEEATPYKKEELNFNKNDKLIIQVASFTPQKDQKTLIQAFKNLPQNYKLILVGQGPLESECKNLTKNLNLINRVYFYGVRSDVPRLLKSVDVVVLSSLYEGLSLSSIEGMASGKPFIASDAPGLNEVVKEAGVLCRIGDVNKFSEIINTLLNDSNYYKEIAYLCMKRAKKYSINLMIDNYIKLYKKSIVQ